jgi:GNAT superfamily N-acetyltransferase
VVSIRPDAPITVRRAVRDDLSDLLAFILALVRETEQRSLDPATVASGLIDALEDPEHRQYWVAVAHEGDEAQTIGCCLVTTEWSDWTGTWYWWFQSVYVLSDWRGKEPGVWNRLYETVCDAGLEAGVRTVKLYVHETNERAMKSYERLGMKRSPYLMYEADL